MHGRQGKLMDDERAGLWHVRLPFATQESLKIARTMHHSENVNSAGNRTIENDDSLETGYSKDPQRFERRVLQPYTPSHFRLCGQKSKGLVRGDQEAMAKFRTSFRGVMVGLFLEVAVGLWANDIRRAH